MPPPPPQKKKKNHKINLYLRITLTFGFFHNNLSIYAKKNSLKKAECHFKLQQSTLLTFVFKFYLCYKDIFCRYQFPARCSPLHHCTVIFTIVCLSFFQCENDCSVYVLLMNCATMPS